MSWKARKGGFTIVSIWYIKLVPSLQLHSHDDTHLFENAFFMLFSIKNMEEELTAIKHVARSMADAVQPSSDTRIWRQRKNTHKEEEENLLK